MSNALYNTGARGLMLAQLNWTTTQMVLLAWGGTPVWNAVHDTVAAIRAATGHTELGTSLLITGGTVAVDGTGQTPQVIIPDIAVGETVTWFTLCKYASPITNAIPILFINQAYYLPYHGNGEELIIAPDWALNRGWFRP